MADTDFAGFPLQATVNDTDKLLGRTAAGGGVNYPGAAFAKRDAAGRIFDGFGATTTSGDVDWNAASNARSGQGVSLLSGSAPNGPAAAASALFHPFGFAFSTSGNITQFAIPYGQPASMAKGMWMRGLFSGAWGAWQQILGDNGSNQFAPMTDNTKSLGGPSLRFSVVYAGTGSINTSDAREKQQIGAIPDVWLDAWADVEWSRFKFNDSVAEKGSEARWHTGLVAQQVRDAFAAHGLDAAEIGLIGLLCHDTWPEVPATEEERDGDGNVIAPAKPGSPAGDRYGLRYEECFAVEAAYQRRRMAVIEVRLAALEGAGAA